MKNLETRKMRVTLFIFWSFFTQRFCKCELIAKQEATLAAPLKKWKLKDVGIFCRKFLIRLPFYAISCHAYKINLLKIQSCHEPVFCRLSLSKTQNTRGCQRLNELVKLKRIGRKWTRPIFKIFVLHLLLIRKSQCAPSNVLHFIVKILMNCHLNKMTHFSTTATSSMHRARFLGSSLIVSDSKRINFFSLSWRSIEHMKILSSSYIFDKCRRSLLHHIS